MPATPGFPTGGGGGLLGLGLRQRQALFADRESTRRRPAETGRPLIFPAELLAFLDATGAPFGTMQSWRELFADTTTPPHGTLLTNQSHGRTDGDYDHAVAMSPPAVLLHYRKDDSGRPQYLIQSAITLHLAQITQVVGVQNVSYMAETIDKSYQTPTALVPVDRWPGLTYPPKSVGSFVFVLVSSAQIMNLYAFEPPQLNPCPGGAAASAPASSSTFILTGGI